LLENAIDAGADEIKLIVKDAGKTLLQIIDNGCGMSETDARMSFERHATSKIHKADDLFHIQTMGFRGEALASIAAIAQVELKTKLHDRDIGSKIIVEGSKVIEQSEIITPSGTSFTIKNLFFNTPARRNFLKAPIVEMRHINEEFIRVALIHPNISFVFFEDDRKKIILTKGSLKQRIIALFGKNYNSKLLSVEENTTVVDIKGFVGKPETARKTRGEQYFFVNHRFIKHPYLNHAVLSAFNELIFDGSFPSYFLHLKVDPANIDVNIHPTKTEVNFKDEKAIYSIIRAAVKMALGKYSLTPQIDFDVEQSLNLNPPPAGTEIRPPQIHYNPDYNPFEQNDDRKKTVDNNGFHDVKLSSRQISNSLNWQELYKNDASNFEIVDDKKDDSEVFDEANFSLHLKNSVFSSLNNRWLVSVIHEGLAIIDRQAAHERVLFDRFSALSEMSKGSSQRKIFPERLQLSATDAELLIDLLPELNALGFEFNALINNEFDVYGTPPDLSNEILLPIIEGMLDYYKLNQMELKIDKRRNVLLSMAKKLSVRQGQELVQEEINALINALFESALPAKSPSGKDIIAIISPSEVAAKFRN